LCFRGRGIDLQVDVAARRRDQISMRAPVRAKRPNIDLEVDATLRLFVPSPVPVTAAIALGSNLGDRAGHIAGAAAAIARLPGTRLIVMGPIIQTRAMTLPGQGPAPDFLNSAVLVETALPPRDLLEFLQAIERDRGRDRSAASGPWAPRTLDLDLLTYGDRTIDEPGLTVPHPRLHERDFVLIPLCAVAPGLVVPGRGPVCDLLASLRASPGADLTGTDDGRPRPWTADASAR
jgi:2-amino-4-hydroxy-6-hydroxymethyldihydropteridine diphosphokinase